MDSPSIEELTAQLHDSDCCYSTAPPLKNRETTAG
jgi:hypothetical protein